ncbi:MAG: Bro-N domain-containing protein [Candidatus Shapirobacteria bacterium]
MNKIQGSPPPVVFQENKIRRHWDEEKELWYFCITDVIEVLTESINPQIYWRVLKKRLIDEGSNQTVTNCNGFKMMAPDGKMRLTDMADTETLFRLIQSIPSPKAEPFKLWLAKVGYQRIEEIDDPELAINRAMKTYLRKGYSQEWINQRLKSIEIRKELTDEWEKRGVKEGREFAILTNEITKAWTDMDIKSYKKLKNLKKENLRDNMTNLELVLNMLAEASTTEISTAIKPQSWTQNVDVAKKGGGVAKKARLEVEKNTGKSLISPLNAKNLHLNKSIK